MGAMVTWEGLPVLRRRLVDSDGIGVIVGGLCFAVGREAEREYVEETPADWVSVVMRSVESSAGRRSAGRSFCEMVSAGPGTACSTTGKLVRARAAMVEDLGQCSRAG